MSKKRPAEAAPETEYNPYETQVLSESKHIPLHIKALDKVLLKTDGKDIIKKSSSRKGRYLIAVAGQLAALAAGKMGTLAELDSQTPVLYLDCPGGRIKLQGRLTFLRNKYITLRVGAKQALCEDVFDMLVLFSRACWVGSKDDNPDEEPLAWPETILAPEPAADAADPLDPLAAPPGNPAKPRSSPKPTAGDGDDSSGDEEEPFTQAATQSTPQLRGSARRSSAKRPNYAEAGLSDGPEQSGSSSQDRDETSDSAAEDVQPTAARKRRKTSAAQPRDAGTSPPEPDIQQAEDKSPLQAKSPATAPKPPRQGRGKPTADTPEGSKPQSRGKAGSSNKKAVADPKVPSAGRTKPKAATIFLLSSDEDGLSPAKPRQPVGRAAKAAASKALVFQSQGDGDDDSLQSSSPEPEPSDDADYD